MAKKQMEKIEDAKWLLTFLELRSKAGPIIHELSQAEGSASYEQKIAAFSKALSELPIILASMRQSPKPKDKRLRTYKNLEESALDAYIKSCEWGIKLLKEPGCAQHAATNFQASLATSYWEISAKEAVAFLRDNSQVLEAGYEMFYELLRLLGIEDTSRGNST
jgi:hypothetical protein